MSPAERVEQRLADLEAMVFGIRGEGGLVHELRGLREDFKEWRKEERGRRESNIRQTVVSLGAACTALLAVIVTLIGLVVR
jgi:hypothetical protein